MLPAGLAAKAIQLCAAGLGAGGMSTPSSYAVTVRTGAVLTAQPSNAANAQATVRDLIALGADFDAGPLAINGKDFATYGVTSASVFDPCALAHVDAQAAAPTLAGPATVSTVTALLRRAFGARITDTIRPMNATYGAQYSWHKYGQAIDFVPAGGVGAIDRAQVRALMAAHGVRLIELLGPGDRGHSNHWHIAFARPGQIIDHLHPIEEDEDWIVNVAGADQAQPPSGTEASGAPATAVQVVEKAPPPWDVFAATQWRARWRRVVIATVLNRLGGIAASLAYPIAGLIAVAAPQPALASDWGCQVVLCLATPGSPTTYAECVPPITKLWQTLAMGGGFPSCTGVGIRTRSTRHGFAMTVTRSDGSTSRYQLDTRTQTVTQQ